MALRHLGLVLVWAVFLIGSIFSQTINLLENSVVNWNITVSATDLSGPGGSDFINFKETAANFVHLGVDVNPNNTAWQITIHRVDTNWPSFLRLYARGTLPANGARFTWTWGQNVYGEVTTVAKQICYGRRDRLTGINIQLRVEGISVDNGLAIGNYVTTIVYTAIAPYP